MDTPENKSNDVAQKEVKNDLMWQEINRLLDEQIRLIESDTGKSAEQIAQEKSDLSTRYLNELKTANDKREKVQNDIQRGREVTTDAQQKANEKVNESLVKVLVAADKNLDIVQDPKAQAFIKDLVSTKPTEAQAVEMMDYLSPWLTGKMPIVFGKEGVKSDFQKAIDQLVAKDSELGKKVVDSMAEKPSDYGFDKSEEIREQFKSPEPKLDDINNPIFDDGKRINEHISSEDEQELIKSGRYSREMIENFDLGENWRYHQELFEPKFSGDQVEFLKIFYTPKRFKKYVENQRKEILSEKGEHLKHEIKKLFHDIKNTEPTEGELNDLFSNKINQEISEKIASELTNVLNQLYIRLQLERPHKVFDEIEKEDFMRGIEPTKLAIKSVIQKLNQNISELIKTKEGKQEFGDLKFAVHRERPYLIQERNDSNGKKQPYLRNVPMPYFEEVGVHDYLQNLQTNFDHWIHRQSYLHDVRASFNHPPGEKGFYGGLAGYAEKLSGTDIDEMMLLPDGQLVYQAYVLYDKIVEEEFASQDWKHRTNQFTNKLEYINTQLEQDVVDRLKELYGNKFTEAQIINAKNAAVGIARGVFLTEPEKSAYADPTTVEGNGMVASYATNDAGALNVFNPLHTILRWQGEGLMNMVFFMPLQNNKGNWDHKANWDNMNNYFKSFIEGKNKKLPNKLFIDDVIDIANVGGPSKRRGWRMQYTLEGHFVYDSVDKDGKKLANPDLNYLETFKAMDVIGYEAIHDFMISRLGDKFLSAKEGPEVKKKDELFRYIFDKYFKVFDPNTSFESYVNNLRKEGIEAADKQLKERGTLSSDKIKTYDEEVELQISNLFLQKFLVREVAARFPTKFLRMDRDRFNDDGISKWRLIYQRMKETNPELTRDKFNDIMKDLNFAEMLLRDEISTTAKDRLNINHELTLNQVADFKGVLNEESIRRLLTENIKKAGGSGISEERINKAVNVYKLIREEFFVNNKRNFLDKEAWELRKNYTFTFGMDDTDFTLMSFRGAGPRTIARAIGDTGAMEREMIPTILKMGHLLNDIAINGKHDFSPIIEYLRKVQSTIIDVHGTPSDYEFTYKIASLVINYFKKDTMAKPLFGLFRLGKRNSIAAEYAGRSSAVWEWDSRDIDRFVTALESYRLIPKNPYDNQKRGVGLEENIWINLFGKPVKTPFKRRRVDWDVNGAKLRKEHGGDWKAITFDMVNQFLPIALALLLWKYIQDSMDEATGKKK